MLTGEAVDVISPFPPVYMDRLIKWCHQYKSLITCDFGPNNDDDLAELMKLVVENHVTYGVVDKYNTCGIKADGPIVVGFFSVDKVTPINHYLHVISQRRVWGKGLMDEACDMVIKDLFEDPNVLRLSASMVANNKAIISFAERHGFKREGLVRDCIIMKGEPRSVAHYGLLRRDL